MTRWLRTSAPTLLAMLRNAVAIDFALTFLGDGPGGHGPQLGAMVARAGLGVLAGVPAWWALLFPGLVAMVLVGAATVLAGTRGPAPAPAAPAPAAPAPAPAPAAAASPPAAPAALAGTRLWPRTRRGDLAEGATVVLGRAVCVLALGAAMFRSLTGSGADGHSALAPLGSDLGATGSLLLGGVAVWGVVTLAQVRLGTRAHVRRRLLPDALARLPGLALGAAPAGWLAFLALYLFSDSVGKLPILPGAHTYVGLTHAPGRWAQSLLIPWLLLGLGLAARTAPVLGDAILAQARSGQQRVARAAGVPESHLARQRRRGLLTPLLELLERELVTLAGITVLIEASFGIPGVGALAVSDFGRGQAVVVSDLAVLAALAVVAVSAGLDLIRLVVDPPMAGS